MKKFIIETATETVLNIIMVDPNNLPVLPSGQEYRDEAGGKGQHWNGAEWVHSDERLAREERDSRDNILVKYVDPLTTNTLRWNDLSSEEQTALSAYRQALLDVPQQEGFPHTHTFPEEP